MIFPLFFGVFLMLCGSGVARAEYILRLPNFPDIRFTEAHVGNAQSPMVLRKLTPKEVPFDFGVPGSDGKTLVPNMNAVWSVIRPKEKVLMEVDVQHYGPDSSGRDHQMIFYTTHAGVLVAQGKEIIFPYSQIMIDKAHLGFLEPYRACFRDITPHGWPADEPRLYASIRVKIRGAIDRLETDEPSVWEGKASSVRFMDVYLRDIEVLKIDCK